MDLESIEVESVPDSCTGTNNNEKTEEEASMGMNNQESIASGQRRKHKDLPLPVKCKNPYISLPIHLWQTFIGYLIS